MRLYFLMFITAVWFLLLPKWERFFKLSQDKVSGSVAGPQSRVNKIGLWLQASIFFIQVLITLIILPSAPKLTATTNNENTHQQFIFRSLQSVSSSNPEIADKVILGKEMWKSVKCFQKTQTFRVYDPSSVWEKTRDMLSSVLYWSRLSCPVSCSQQLYFLLAYGEYSI